jgi:hypothetical protein
MNVKVLWGWGYDTIQGKISKRLKNGHKTVTIP